MSSNWLDAAWMEQGVQALKDMLRVDHHLRKQMIEFLFEEGFWDSTKLSWDAAVARWNDCLNPDKASFFKIAELWALAKRFDRKQLIEAMVADLGGEIRWLPTPERLQATLDRLAEAQERLANETSAATRELQRIQDVTTTGTATIYTRPGAAPRRFDLDEGGMPEGGF